MKTPRNQLQATTLVALFRAGLLIRISTDDSVKPCWPRPDVEFGHRLCRAYESYLLLHNKPALNFEWAWRLLHSIAWNDELYLAVCAWCSSRYVQDAYAIDNATCPACEVSRKTV